MEYIKIGKINEYVSQSINPMKTPDTIFEMYSVPVYDTGHPEYLRGDEIASSKIVVQKDDILLCKINPRINRVWVVNDESDKQNIASSEWIVIRTKTYNPEYLAWYFRTPNFQKLMTSEVTGIGGSLTRAQPKRVAEYPVPVLGREKQDEIVCALNRVKKLIEARKQELQELDNLIKSRFVELFGHQSHNEKSMPYLTIDDVAEIYLGITHTPTYVENGVMFISAKNTSGDFLDLSDVKYISREEFESAPKGSKPQINDVLFSRVGSNLGHPVILEEDLELCTFVSLGFLRTKGNVTSNYLKHWMRDDFFAKQVSEHVKGGGQPNLNTGWLKEFKIIVPDIECQREFDDFCKQVDKLKFFTINYTKLLHKGVNSFGN